MTKLNRASIAAAFLALATLPAVAGDIYTSSCDELWVMRNQVYKEAGYCFRTPQAIAYFGNDGCRYYTESEVPLSSNDRRFIRNIREAERQQRCRG